MTVYKRLDTRVDLEHRMTKEQAADSKKTRTLQPILTSYALEDPMYEYMQEKKKREKDERIRQLKDLLDSSTDSSSDSSGSSEHGSKHNRKKKRKKGSKYESDKKKKLKIADDTEKSKKKRNKDKKKKRKKHKGKSSKDDVEWVDSSKVHINSVKQEKPDRINITSHSSKVKTPDDEFVKIKVEPGCSKDITGSNEMLIKTEPEVTFPSGDVSVSHHNESSASIGLVKQESGINPTGDIIGEVQTETVKDEDRIQRIMQHISQHCVNELKF